MIVKKRFLLTAAALMMLAACSAEDKAEEASESRASFWGDGQSSVSSDDTDSSEPEKPRPTETPVTELPPTGTVPVLRITTENSSENVMDFVKLPVNGYVSAQIATWTPNYEMPPEPYPERSFVSLTDTDGTELFSGASADVKVRGNWTTNYVKKPLVIKFDEKQAMLGMNGGAECKSWILLAEYKDASMLRNKAALQISREILGADGLYAADSRFVEVYINDQYWGLYLLTEKQQVNDNRVNITKPEKEQTSTDIGYLLEFDGYYLNEEPLQSFFVDYAGNAPLIPFDGNGGGGRTETCLPMNGSDPKKEVGIAIKSDIRSQEQHDFIESFVNNVYDIMYAAAYEDKAMSFSEDFANISEDASITPREAVERVVDTDSLADMFIISELTCDADIYWSSFFMSADFGEGGSRKLRFEAPWDFDSSMGNKDRCVDGKGFYAANIVPDVNGNEYETINPWLAVLMYQDWFRDIIKEKWTKAYDSGVFERALLMIDDDKTDLSEAFDSNYKRWRNLLNKKEFESELSEQAKACRTHEQAADFLYSWLESRVEFMNAYWHK